jgi:sugar-specific transcriptional regulator TrmB
MRYDTLNKKEQKEIGEVLSGLGLNEKEKAVYLALLEKGQGQSLSGAAKLVGMPLTSVKYVVTQLEKNGFVDITKKRTQNIYGAADPHLLKKILERKIQDVNDIIPILNKLKADGFDPARIRIYNRDRMSDIFLNALKAKEKLIYEIVSARDLQYILGEKLHFTRRRVEASVRLRSLRVEEYEIKRYNKRLHEKELREAKFLPRELSFRSSIMIWDDNCAFFTTKEEGLAWVVRSRTTAEMMRQLFDLLWSVSRRMETLIE